MRIRNSQKSGIRTESEEYARYCLLNEDIVQYTLHILEDVFNMNNLYGRTDYLRDRETILRRSSHEGLSFITKTLPSLFDSLLVYLETGKSVYPGYKIYPGQLYPAFLQQLVAPIYEDHMSNSAVLCIEHLYQLCAAFKKLKGPYKKSALIKQLNEFIEVDQSLSSKDWSDEDLHILSKARVLIKKVVKDLNPFDCLQSESFLPRPGPGATNTPTEKHERYHPHVLYAQLCNHFDPNEWYTSQPLNYRGHKAYLLSDHTDETVSAIKTADYPTSRLKFVHKTFGKARSICIEQLETQWLQQGVRRALYDCIERHPLTKGFVSFTDQSINGLLALQASLYRDGNDFATIDMSSASDRISRELVEFLFQDNVPLLKALLCLSTRVIELPKDLSPNRRWLHTRKYAPMGSALCFPVMGLIHYALVKSIISVKCTTPLHINDIPAWVYGDDIIISKAYAAAVFSTLPHFGMKLNESKSFCKSLFRESCGVHAYDGVDITPVQFKTIAHNPLSMNEIVSALQNEAVLFKKGYVQTSNFILNKLQDIKGLGKLPVVSEKSAVLGIIRDDETATRGRCYYSLRRRWNLDWQRYLYKARVISVVNDRDAPPLDDCEYYLRKLVEKSHYARKIDGSSTSLTVKWKWLPDSAFFAQT